MTAATDRLDEVRQKLAEAEAAIEGLAEDATTAVRKAAEDHKAVVEKALVAAKANVEKEVREAEAEAAKVVHEAETEAHKLETRPAPGASEVRQGPDVLQALVQAGSIQNVRGTDKLTEEEHAKRRNPQGS